jgi:uncharacterized protein YcbK (DUF882 family)
MPTTPIKKGQLTANFHISEFACNDAANTPVPKKYEANVKKVAENLQVLRDYLGEVIRVNSGYRTVAYNTKLQGASPNSQHLQAKAADIIVGSKTPRQLHAIIEKLIKQGKMHNGGLGLYKTFVHFDVRATPARWNMTK